MFFTQRNLNRITRQLVMLLEEEVSLVTALGLIATQQRSRRWQNILFDVRKRVNDGESITQALSRHKAFDHRYRDAIDWAERTGSADNLLVALRLLADDTASRFPRRLDKGPAWSQHDEM